ncbi:MAG: response regulator transcription factor, partial [Chloroflexi bacterium]|nr:response regulator transcription factor [Chloroflexota bacterium]
MDRSKQILLIEDDPAVATSVEDALTQEGYRVRHESTGEAGIRSAIEHQPQLVVLDLRLPDMSGFDVCRQLRGMSFRQPILILTVQAEETDKVLGLELGADDYLTKPFGIREFISRVRALMRRAYGELASNSGDTVYVRDLVIDVLRGEVRRGKSTIDLTPTEFRLLLFLARSPGRVYSRPQIIEAVWKDDSDPDSERA